LDGKISPKAEKEEKLEEFSPINNDFPQESITH
jgi:hypothetical protein